MIDKKQAQIMRFRILRDLDADEGDPNVLFDEDGKAFVDIDQRFVDQIFSDNSHMHEWCEGWKIEASDYSLGGGRNRPRSNWVRFKKKVV